MLELAVLTGMAAYAMVSVMRRLGPIERRALAGRRPWACDVCMAWWAVAFWRLAAVVAAWEFDLYADAFEGAAGLGVALIMLRWSATQTSPSPPELH